MKENGQFSLFTPAPVSEAVVMDVSEHHILEALRDLDVAHLTPLDALVKLDAWKRSLEEKSVR